MKANVTALLECEITDWELSKALFQKAYDMLTDNGRDPIDDAGCDWATDENGGIYIKYDKTVRVARNKVAATLIDAANILRGYDLARHNPDAETAAKIPDIYS